MISFDTFIEISCQGKYEDIKNMDRRLRVIKQNKNTINSAVKLKRIFGDELSEIRHSGNPKPVNVDNEVERLITFSGLMFVMKGGWTNTDNNAWENWDDKYFDRSYCEDFFSFRDELKLYDDAGGYNDFSVKELETQGFGDEIILFFSTIKKVFPRIKFHLMFECFGYGVHIHSKMGINQKGFYCWDEKYENASYAFEDWQKAFRDLYFFDKDESIKNWIEIYKNEAEKRAQFEHLVYNIQKEDKDFLQYGGLQCLTS